MAANNCSKCGATSYASTLFCQSCGEALTSTGDLSRGPLSKGTDQSSTSNWYGATPPPQPYPVPPQMPMAYPPRPPVYMPPNPYACRYCGSPFPPQVVRKLSTFGWFVLFFGLLFCLVGALLAFACMEDRRICPSCGSTLN